MRLPGAIAWGAAALAALALAACSQPAEEGLVLTYGTPYGPGHPFSRADSEWMAFVEAESGGAIRIKTYWSGGLLSADESMLEVRHGVVDIGLITPIYARGGAHLLRTQAGFYGGVRSYADQLKVYACMASAFPEFAEELEGLKVLAVQGGNLPGVLTRDRQVRSLEDFRGLRLRAPSELTGLLASLGADPVNMPMGEVYSALAKGVIDGVVAPADTLQSLHFDEVAKHFSMAQFARGAYPARAMSLKVWESLPDHAKQVLERSIPVWEQAMQSEITAAQERGFAYGREKQIDFVDFGPDDQAKLDALYNEHALTEARRFSGVDASAEPVLRRAQEIIALRNSGQDAPCRTPQS